jgi:DNA-binding PadR family transcriptional regulator
MDIELAILAHLSHGPRSGYDLKKLFAESESLHWSGNNNQVYRALLALHQQGFAEREVQQPFEGPARKLYTLTAAGRAELRRRLLEPSELPALRVPVLVTLLGAAVLSDGELDEILSAYAHELRLKVLGLEELRRRRGPAAGANRRQAVLAEAIDQRAVQFFRSEEEWVRDLRWALARVPANEVAQ